MTNNNILTNLKHQVVNAGCLFTFKMSVYVLPHQPYHINLSG